MIFKVTKTRKSPIYRVLLDWISTIVIAVVISLFIVSNIATITQIKEQSMEPTFKEDDRVIVYKLGYHFVGPKRGDLIILDKNKIEKGFLISMVNEGKDIVNNISSRFTGVIKKNNLIKRVVAVPGDTLDIKNGIVYINGKEESGYKFTGLTYENSNFSYPLEIPVDKVFVLGDNRENSLDSRGLGLIDYSQIKGKVSFRLWPLSRLGIVK